MHLETASNGYDLWECIQMLPSFHEKWGHAITMTNIFTAISWDAFPLWQKRMIKRMLDKSNKECLIRVTLPIH
jgi:hypothetical protein